MCCYIRIWENKDGVLVSYDKLFVFALVSFTTPFSISTITDWGFDFISLLIGLWKIFAAVRSSLLIHPIKCESTDLFDQSTHKFQIFLSIEIFLSRPSRKMKIMLSKRIATGRIFRAFRSFIVEIVRLWDCFLRKKPKSHFEREIFLHILVVITLLQQPKVTTNIR